jgi:transglutaminase-like putative cysteine protease
VAGLRPSDPTDPGRLLFTVNTDRATSNYVALASVDYYDGDSWSFSRTFRPSGGSIPADPDPSMQAPGAEVTQRYELADGPLTSAPWMPHLDRATRVTGVPVDVDAASGMFVAAAPIMAGSTYTVTSAVPSRSVADLRRSALLGTSASPLDTALPNGLSGPSSALVNALAQETGVPFDSPIPFLQAVAEQLQSATALAGAAPSTAATPDPSPSPSVTPGSAHTGGTAFADVLASIRGARSGTPEQFATFMALVARRLNVPARVVSGFRLPTDGAVALPAGTYRVTSREAWTWVEIPIRGLGWVVLDAAPNLYAGQTPEPTAGVTRSPSPTPTPSQNALVNRSNNGGHAVAPPSRTERRSGASGVAIAVFIAVATALFVMVGVALLLARKGLRQRRRRRGDPRRRVIGAWQESVDLLVEAGLADLSAATTREVAAATTERFGSGPGEQALAVGTAADVAIFSPRTALQTEQADAAWRAHAELRHAVCRSLPLHTRVAARLRYHRPRH